MEREPEELELATRVGRGDRGALAPLVERLRLWLFAVAYRELGHYEDAQDAVAAALVRVCNHAGDLRDPRQVRSWMSAIVRNEARRVRARSASSCVEADLACEPDDGAHSRGADLRIDIDRALRRLPIDQARAISLHYLAGMPLRAIAERTRRPEGTVKSWLHHGRRNLADYLKEYAPMASRTPTAAIISTDLDGEALNGLTAALQAAGYPSVKRIADYRSVARLEQTGEGGASEVHVCEPLRGVDLIIVDEWIGGRSAFEFFAILRATVERERMAACILLNRSDEPFPSIAITSAWASGFDLCLTKPVDATEFSGLARRVRDRLEQDGA